MRVIFSEQLPQSILKLLIKLFDQKHFKVECAHHHFWNIGQQVRFRLAKMMQGAYNTDCRFDLLNFDVVVFDKHQHLLLNLIPIALIIDITQVLVVFFYAHL